MRKLLLLLICCLLWSQYSFAQHLTIEEAAQRAIDYLEQGDISVMQRSFKPTKRQKLTMAEARSGLYIYNIEGGGFIITPSTEMFFPVLCYVTTDSYDYESMPDALKAWMDSYPEVEAYMSQTNNIVQIDRATIEPLLKTQWGQGDPYNRLCPEVNGKRCVTGCVATAIAQIMRYYCQPTSSNAIYAYRTRTHKLHMKKLPATDFDWLEMLDTYDSSASEASCNAVAKLMLYCGCAFSMDYTPEGSAADVTPVCDGIPYYFGYDDSMQRVERKNYNDETWETMIYEQIANGYPVLYSGRNSTSGHAFVCDGYEKGLFHINWGWQGFCDSWFHLSLLYPNNAEEDNDGYSENQVAVINFKPQGWNAGINNISHACMPINDKAFNILGMDVSNYGYKGLKILRRKDGSIIKTFSNR